MTLTCAAPSAYLNLPVLLTIYRTQTTPPPPSSCDFHIQISFLGVNWQPVEWHPKPQPRLRIPGLKGYRFVHPAPDREEQESKVISCWSDASLASPTSTSTMFCWHCKRLAFRWVAAAWEIWGDFLSCSGRDSVEKVQCLLWKCERVSLFIFWRAIGKFEKEKLSTMRVKWCFSLDLIKDAVKMVWI